MRYLVHSMLLIAGACALHPIPAHAGAPNVMTIVVANGPFAGTYKTPASETICMHAKKQRVYSAAWKDFDSPGAKALAEAGVQVSNPDVPGSKYGTVRIAFGGPDKDATVYAVHNEPLTLTVDGKRGTIAFEGKTKEGVRLQLTASCAEVEEL